MMYIPFFNPVYFWVNFTLLFLGTLFNSIFLWISTKNSARRKLTDLTIVVACLANTLKGFCILVSSVIGQHEDTSSNIDVLTGTETTNFFLDGIYTWSILILNIHRYKLLGKLRSSHDQTNDKNFSKNYLLSSIVITSVLSIAYAVNLWVNKFPDSKNTIIRVLNFLAKDAAFMISIILNIVTIDGLYKFRRRRYNSIRPLARTSTFPNDPKSSILLRQFMLSLIFQAIFYIVPGILRIISEFINLNCAFKTDSDALYSFSDLVLVLFTPCAFGILAEPRRGYLLELFCFRKSSEGVDTNVSAERRNTQNIGESPGQWNCRAINLPEIASNLAQSTEIPLDVTTIVADTKIQGRDIKRQYQSRQYFTDINKKNGTPTAYSLKSYIKKKQSTDMSIISCQSETSFFGSFSDISSIQGTVSFLDTNQRRGRSISTIIQRPTSFSTLMQRPSSISDVLSII